TVRLVPPEGGPVLDLCTGTGDLALEYHKAGRGRVSVVGADFCHPMLTRATAKARRARADITFVEADAQRLPFAAATFQVTPVAFGLRNVPDTGLGLAEMVRVTRPGGRVAVLEFSRPRQPLVGRLYRWYFLRVLPAVGNALSR